MPELCFYVEKVFLKVKCQAKVKISKICDLYDRYQSTG